MDFSLPERFALEYTGSDGQPHRPVMIHRAVFGSIERFMGLLIEHFAGDFPLWLSPEQIRFIPITDGQLETVQALAARARKAGLRIRIDQARDSMGAKIRRAQTEKSPLIVVVGKREAEGGTVSVRSRRHGDEGVQTADAFFERVRAEIDEALAS